MSDEGDRGELEALEAVLPRPSRKKLVLIAVAVVLVGLGIAFGVFQAISAGIESAAPRAAGYLAPEGQQADQAPPPPPAPPPAAPTAPGL